MPGDFVAHRLEEIGHAELFGFALNHALVEHFGLGQLVLEEALVTIPAFVLASRMNRAKSICSSGFEPSVVNSVPIRPSSSRPAISWQPAQP